MATFRRINGAFFEETPQGLDAAAVSPEELQGLQSRQIQFTEGSLGTAKVANPLEQGGAIQTSAQGTTGSPVASFNYLLNDLLQRARGVDTPELYKRKRALQRATIGKVQEITPEELRTLSPAQQASIRSGEVSGMETELDIVDEQIRTAEKRVSSFEDIIKEARKLSDDFAEKMMPSEDVIKSYTDLIYAGQPIATILAGTTDKVRQAVIAQIDPAKIQQEKKTTQSTVTTDRGIERIVFDEVGNVIKRTVIGQKSNSGTSSIISSKDETALRKSLTASKFEGEEADGKYADPNLYYENYKAFMEAGGDADEFFRMFPPSTYVNPSNDWLPEEIMKFAI